MPSASALRTVSFTRTPVPSLAKCRSNTAGDTVIREYKASSANPDRVASGSGRTLLKIDQPYSNGIWYDVGIVITKKIKAPHGRLLKQKFYSAGVITQALP